MEKLRTLWHEVTDSLWFVPGLLTTAGAALAILLVNYNDAILGETEADDVWWVFGGSPTGALSVLESISSSIITVTGVVFSVTIIALQLASNQFTPRVLRQFMADKANQLVLGVFIATFTYALVVQRTVRTGDESEFVPAVAVTGAVILALTSIGFFIFFINHLARSIQAAVMIDSAANSTMQVLRAVFPDDLPDCDDPERPTADDLTPGFDGAPREVRARKAGYVQSYERNRLRRLAEDHDLFIRLELEIGSYVLPGQVIMSVWPGESVSEEMAGAMCGMLIQGMERTPHQDLKHGVIEVMDIAVKALSPSFNDPTTAVNAIQRLSQVLLDMAWRGGGDTAEKDEDGTIRLAIRRARLDDTVDLAYNQIRHYGAGNPTVAVALIETLGELVALSPHVARPAFMHQLRAVIDSARLVIEDEGDKARVEVAVDRAMQRAESLPPRQRPHR